MQIFENVLIGIGIISVNGMILWKKKHGLNLNYLPNLVLLSSINWSSRKCQFSSRDSIDFLVSQ